MFIDVMADFSRKLSERVARQSAGGLAGAQQERREALKAYDRKRRRQQIMTAGVAVGALIALGIASLDAAHRARLSRPRPPSPPRRPNRRRLSWWPPPSRPSCPTRRRPRRRRNPLRRARRRRARARAAARRRGAGSPEAIARLRLQSRASRRRRRTHDRRRRHELPAEQRPTADAATSTASCWSSFARIPRRRWRRRRVRTAQRTRTARPPPAIPARSINSGAGSTRWCADAVRSPPGRRVAIDAVPFATDRPPRRPHGR